MSDTGIHYLATPYTHSDPEVVEGRFLTANKVAALLMNQGLHIYSPISHTHPIALAGDLPTTWDFWEQYDRVMLKVCSSLLIIAADGWDRSKGVKAEIEIAKEYGLPIRFVSPEGELDKLTYDFKQNQILGL
jgi:hypothetical protein